MTEQRPPNNVGWWEWLGWKGSPTPALQHPAEEPIPTTSVVAVVAPKIVNQTVVVPQTGWERLKAIYERENSMEKDVTIRVVRMSFLGGFLVGGATGYAQARHAYETNNVGRKYLSPSDAVKRKIDYAIVRFAKGGFGTGFKCALISGSIVFLTTHVTAYRDKFASWYFPAISALVGGVFTFPIGLIGSMKAVGLGVSSGLTLSAVVHLYAMGIDKPVNDAYKLFKRDYEKELKSAAEWDSRVSELMEREQIVWRQQAVKKLKQLDHERMAVNDD
uniref:Complex I assembly factor TIMMDC1, mitochondrial n=1 Tax=Caenorhabditis tropicalis TaxID=1561998 RepID=A0A1I7TQH8_9PELO